jgi:glycosyltransferase involved in cell wall biosynthesis
MKVLLVSNYYPEHVGGIEAVAHQLSRWYRRHGHQVRWMAGDVRRNPHVGHVDDVPLRIWNVTESRLGFPYPLPSPISLTSVVREVERCDVVHVHDCLYAANVVAYGAARRVGRPVLVTQHIAGVRYRHAPVRWLQRMAYASVGSRLLSGADQVVFVSQSVLEHFAAHTTFRNPPQLLENGIDLEVFMPADATERRRLKERLNFPAEKPLMLFVGRFVEKKGIGLLRTAIEDTPDWSWLLIGRADDENPSNWKLANLSILPPQSQEDLRDFYAAADIVVLPSTGEGFPLVAQEAMACGTPVVVSDETAGRAAPEVRALLFSSSLDSRHLVSVARGALTKLQSSPGLRRQAAQLALQRWSAECSAQRYEEIMAGLVQTRGDRHV